MRTCETDRVRLGIPIQDGCRCISVPVCVSVCSKEYPAPESGRDAAKPVGVAPVCRGDFLAILIRVPRYRGNEAVGSDLTTSEVIVWVILIHADSATIFPGTARIAVQR